MTPIFQCKFGSHLYGLDTPNSDTDIKGVFIPSKEDIILGRCKDTIKGSTSDGSRKNGSYDVDHEMMSLQYFCRQLSEGKTAAIDMIHCPDDYATIRSEAWDWLRAHRSEFYSTKMTNEFLDYVNHQVAKYGVAGSRVDNLYRVLTFLKNESSVLPIGNLAHRFPDCVEVNQEEKFVHFFGRLFPFNMKVHVMTDSLQKEFGRVGQRFIEANNNENIDWKAVSHALRAGYQLLSIYHTGDLKYPFTDELHDLLMNIKLGHCDFRTEAQPIIEDCVRRVLEATQTAADNGMRSVVDQKMVDHFVFCQYQRATLPDFWS